jgi:hypothetical protein
MLVALARERLGDRHVTADNISRQIDRPLVAHHLAVYADTEGSVRRSGRGTYPSWPTMLVLGMLTLIAGLAMVLGHNVWSGSALPIIVTIVGWITLIRSVVLLFVPPQALDRTFQAIRFEEFYYVFLAIPLMLGLYLTYAAFTAPAAGVGGR